jgi:hypothetical protein
MARDCLTSSPVGKRAVKCVYISTLAIPKPAQHGRVSLSARKVQSPEDAIFADLDGDGRLEIVSLTEGKTRSLFWHRFTGAADQLLQSEHWTTSTFPATAGTQKWMQAAALDVEEQHGSDLLLASKNKDATVG